MRSFVRSAFAVALLLGSSSLFAQATRTWVSGVGDDANPCSRTAPCKTFAGAISKTATGGEINVLDPGGFGGVTITKSITISSEGFEAGVLVSGTNAIIINGISTTNVILRGLDIEGLGTGLAGIKFLAGNSLSVENCTINNFTQPAIDFEPNLAGVANPHLNVTDTIIRNCGGGGILVKPGVNVTTAFAAINNLVAFRNLYGVRAEDRSKVAVNHSMADSNSGNGYLVFSAGVAADLTVRSSVATNTTTNGVAASGAQAKLTITDNDISYNGTGILNSSGQVFGCGDNRLLNNTTPSSGAITPCPAGFNP